MRTGEPGADTVSACSTGTASSSQLGVVTAPQQAQIFEIRWYSVTVGGGAGDTSITCRRCLPSSAAPARDASQR
jgi:hypothetical protein